MTGTGEASLHPPLHLNIGGEASSWLDDATSAFSMPDQSRDLPHFTVDIVAANPVGSDPYVGSVRNNPHQFVIPFLAEDDGQSNGTCPCHRERGDRFCPPIERVSCTRQSIPTTVGKSLALPSSQILQRRDLRGVLLPVLGWPAPPLSVLGRCLLPLAGPWLVGLLHGDEAVPFEGLHAQAAARCRPADGGAQSPSALPFYQWHPHGLAGCDLGEEGGHGRVRLPDFLLP